MTILRSNQSYESQLLARTQPSTWLRVLRVLLPVALGSSLGAAYMLRSGVHYRAEVTLEYAQDPAAVAKSGNLEGLLISDEWYNTQDYLLHSQPVIEEVAKRLRLNEDRGFFATGGPRKFPAPLAAAAARLHHAIQVTRVQGTRLVRVSVEDTSSRRAARIANTLAQTYLEQSRTVRIEAQANALRWLADQIDTTSSELASTEQELERASTSEGAPHLSLAEEQAIVVDEIKSLTQTLTSARVNRIELNARVSKLKNAQSENPFEVHTLELDDNEQVKQLASEYQSAFIKFKELEATGQTGPAVEAEQSTLRILSERMRFAIAGVLKSYQAELVSAQAVETQLQSQLQTAEQKAAALQRYALEFGQMERARSEKTQLLTTLRERSTAIGIASASGAANARVVEPATVPGQPQPRMWWIGAGVGFLVGIVLAALLKRVSAALAPQTFELKR